MKRLTSTLALLGALALGACGQGEQAGAGDREVGEACTAAAQCEHGLCAAGVAGEEPVCTRSCGDTSECPRGWSCSGVTDDNVLVCQRGAGNPFGVGARE